MSPPRASLYSSPAGAIPIRREQVESVPPIVYGGDRNTMMPEEIGAVGKTAPPTASPPNEDATTLSARPVKPVPSAVSGDPAPPWGADDVLTTAVVTTAVAG